MRTPFFARLLCLAVPIAVGPRAEAPCFQPPSGAKLTKRFVQKVDSALIGIEIEIDGEKIEQEDEEVPTIETRREETIVVEDEYVALAAGRPEELVRTYAKIHAASAQVIAFGDERAEQQSEEGSPLEGRAVRFRWDEEANGYDKSFAEGDGDEQLLEPLDEDMDLRDWLPRSTDGVEPGASWEVPLDAFRYHLFAGGLDLTDLESEDSASEDDSAPDQGWAEYLEHASGDIRARWIESADNLARIEIEIRFEGWIEPESTDGESTQIRFEFDLEGELVWNLEAKRVERFEVEGETREEIETSAESEDGPRISRTMIFEGRTSFSVATGDE